MNILNRYVDEYAALIDIEREAEIKATRREIQVLSARERERIGRAVLDVKGKLLGKHYDGYIVRYGRALPIETVLSSGDIVLISRGNPLRSDLLATVYKTAKNFIEVLFSSYPPKWALKDEVRIDLYVNDVTFKRMLTNLEALRQATGPYARMRDIVLGIRRASPAIKRALPLTTMLNTPQVEAVQAALNPEPVVLIHGPPGTGKTTTAVEVMRQSVRLGRKVLATADSNIAVDNMISKLSSYAPTIRCLRIGHPIRVDTTLEKYTLSYRLDKHPKQQIIRRLQRRIDCILKLRNHHTKPTPGLLRGMSKTRIETLASKGKSMRGVDAKTIMSMARWIRCERLIEALFRRLRHVEKDIIDELFNESDIVFSTNGMVGSEIMQGRFFDMTVIDEAGQQIEPSTLLPLMRAPKAVLLGDHKQLPPTVISENEILKVSLFERLMLREDIPSYMLKVQYRMNETVMEFPNRLMYEGKLIAHRSVAKRTLPIRSLPHDTFWRQVLDPDCGVCFIDTQDQEGETLAKHTTSYENRTEAKLIVSSAEALLQGGINPKDIAVITPYDAQRRLLQKLLRSLRIECNSVDGFQGREKEVVLISFVRSNIAHAVGFVQSDRRLNVAMTRAKTKIIMVGSYQTLCKHYPFDKLFKWLKKRKGLLRYHGKTDTK